MRIGVVILCRYNSSRLPGKILRDLNGKPALQHTYDRLRKLINAEDIVVATSTEETDDPIVDYCASNNISVVRGDLDNVASRFLYASEISNFDYAIRTNGDNIFIDLEAFSRAIEIAKNGQYDFVSNVDGRTFPKGMSIEVVKTSFYKKLLNKIESNEDYKEHVTLGIYQNNWGKTHFFYNTKVPGVKGIDLALDTIEDFSVIAKMITLLGSKYEDYCLLDIAEIYDKLER